LLIINRLHYVNAKEIISDSGKNIATGTDSASTTIRNHFKLNIETLQLPFDNSLKQSSYANQNKLLALCIAAQS